MASDFSVSQREQLEFFVTDQTPGQNLKKLNKVLSDQGPMFSFKKLFREKIVEIISISTQITAS
jgi:hypothetical protein